MEKLARKLASEISVSLGYDGEREAVIAYGLVAIIQTIIVVLLIFALGMLLGVAAEALIVCFSVSIFRKYSGGAHAKTAELCTCFSVLYCVAMAVLSQRLLTGIYRPPFMAMAVILVFGLSFFIVYKFAPVDSPNKPIRAEKKIKRMRRGSFLILSAYLALSVLLLLFAGRYEICKSFGISLLFGVSWQTFTLTHSGALFIGRMNALAH